MGDGPDEERRRPHPLLGEREDDPRDDQAEEERVGEAHTGEAAVELHRVVDELGAAGEIEPVDGPLREDVRGVGPKQAEDDADLGRDVGLDQVGLEVVGGPAHLRARRRSAPIASVARSTIGIDSQNPSRKTGGFQTPSAT